MAIAAAKALGVNFVGVDIIIDQNMKDVYVLDVNMFPGFPKKRTFDLSAHLISILINYLNKK